MKTIEENAKEYAKSSYEKETAYIEGAKDVLSELMLCISVSEGGWLEYNVNKLIENLKGNLKFDNEIVNDDELPF